MINAKSIISSIIILIFPIKICYWVLNFFGHKIDPSSKVGFSIIFSNKIILGKNAIIGHGNFIQINCLDLSKESKIKHFNIIKGPLLLTLDHEAIIGKFNTALRSRLSITYGEAQLYIGKKSIIVANHFLDCTRNIHIGNFSILAGKSSQIWTHGYYHAAEGPERFRVDGDVNIGNNVYIGSMCLINPGVYITNSIIIGGNSTVSKSLTETGMYVSQPLRFIPTSYEEAKLKLSKVSVNGLVEEVYEKRNSVN